MAKLYYRYGAMNSGKTTALLQVAFNYNERGMRVLILKASVDTKGGDHIVSRLGSATRWMCWSAQTWTSWISSGPIPPPMAAPLPVCCVTKASSLPRRRPSSCFWSRWT